jgi:NAD(P)H-flavin reductase/NAD-dependent dihydropyrimidine dehydrogenase PreA subunit
MFVRRVMMVSQFWGTMKFFDKLGFLLTIQYLVMPTIVGSLLALFINPRTWCSICPMGTMEEVMYKVGKALGINKKTDRKVTVEAEEKCHKCGTCARVCPLQLEPYSQFEDNNQFEEETCIRCGTCVENCPAEILSFENSDEANQLIESTDLEGYKERRAIKAIIEDINILKDDIKEYTFKFEKPEKANYKPGQFILVKVSDDPEIYRAYSISSAEIDDKSRLRVTIQKVEDGYGTTIIDNEFKIGDTVELEGPMGDEIVVDKSAEKVLLVGGGIGITPFVPIVKDIVENKNSIKDAKLIYGVNKIDDFMYDDYFAELDSKSAKFEYIRTVASPDQNWDGYQGFVTDVLKQMDISGYKLYLCGPGPMVDATLELLAEMRDEDRGIPSEDIFYESA